MSIFSGGTQKPTKQSIAVKASNALSMFSFAIKDLEDANTEAEVLKLENQTIIDDLTADNKELDALTTSNDNVVTKIKKLIS